MGNKKLAKELGLEDDQAYELFNKYHSKVPFVKEMRAIRVLSAATCKFSHLVQRITFFPLVK